MRLAIACLTWGNIWLMLTVLDFVNGWDDVTAYYLGAAWLVIGASMLIDPKWILTKLVGEGK